jgi:hypothetical protein
MKPVNFFIKDIKEFQSANNNLKNIFNTNKELPIKYLTKGVIITYLKSSTGAGVRSFGLLYNI